MIMNVIVNVIANVLVNVMIETKITNAIKALNSGEQFPRTLPGLHGASGSKPLPVTS